MTPFRCPPPASHLFHHEFDGIVHGAGILDDHLLADKDPEAFARVFATKVDPARALLVDDSLPVLHSARQYGIGQPVSILHPDSSLPKRLDTDPFPAIDDFLAVLP